MFLGLALERGTEILINFGLLHTEQRAQQLSKHKGCYGALTNTEVALGDDNK